MVTHRDALRRLRRAARSRSPPRSCPSGGPQPDLFEIAKHNFNTIRGVNAEHAQILLDFIVCGINDDPGEPVRGCENPPQGQPRPGPRPAQPF